MRLISSWSLEGENLLWRHDFRGRSTAVVFDGQVCALGRVGEGIEKQERVVCYAADDGRVLWEHRFNVFLTTVPYPRVGWANPTFDPETGNLYVHGVAGLLICFDPDGGILWQRSMTEEFGRMSGYGGRTHTPVIDGDLVIWSAVTASWGQLARPLHRYFAFDKRTGELIWVAAPGGAPKDLNTYSTPVVAGVDERRLLIAGNADGSIYAMNVATGETVWKFELSKRGINSSPVFFGNRVFVGHGEENIDEATMGRVVCIDATGRGDVTRTHEVWRHATALGSASPAVQGGHVYLIDNSANLSSLDAANGKLQWEENIGTVGKGSPVVADRKLFVTETNGVFLIMQPSASGVTELSRVVIPMEAQDRRAEIYGSPVISGGRIFFVTEEGIYALGRQDRPFDRGEAAALPPAVSGQGAAARLQIVPAITIVEAGEPVQFRIEAFDAHGRRLSDGSPRSMAGSDLSWSLDGLTGTVSADGTFTGAASDQAGHVVVTAGVLTSRARVRVVRKPPWTEDFESIAEGTFPGHWIGANGRFAVQRQENGNNVLVKPVITRGIQRSYVYFGPATMSNYTLQVDARGAFQRRRVPDMGLISNRYILILSGKDKQLRVHSWASELRMQQSVDIDWEPDVWYTIKMQVDSSGGKALIRGKFWKRDEAEPAEWTILAQDPLPNRQGTPGLYGQSYAEIYYDNLKLTPNP